MSNQIRELVGEYRHISNSNIRQLVGEYCHISTHVVIKYRQLFREYHTLLNKPAETFPAENFQKTRWEIYFFAPPWLLYCTR